ncbi:MAG: endo-1,4-beta-xylanase [Leptolyngbya sp. SIO3F4]|nr:endo-1,4-beta-xylanase [Leptolyngbya sp. SIO3F4]
MASTLRSLAADIGFQVGGAISIGYLDIPKYQSIASEHFNLLVSMGDFKVHNIRPTPTDWIFDKTDRLVDFAEENNQTVRGHTLCWHLACSDWMKTLDGPDLERVLRDFIMELVSRYRGRISAWDVVNEAIDDLGHPRTSVWKKIENFIPKCFQWAHEADPDTELLYLDYRIHTVGRWKAIAKMVRELKSAGIPIHGVGMQLHHNVMRSLAISNLRLEGAIRDLKTLGVNVHLCEITVGLDPKVQALPQSVGYKLHAQAYRQIAQAALKGGASSMTIWNPYDKHIKYVLRKAIPGIFDEVYQAKPAYHALVDVFSKHSALVN